jgi:hypothetical protein
VNSQPVQRKINHCIDCFFDNCIIIRKFDERGKRQQKPSGSMQNISWGVSFKKSTSEFKIS